MIAAARADELKQACVTAFETAIHDAGLLAPQDRRCAMAGLTWGRERVGVVRLAAQPLITTSAEVRYGGGRTRNPPVTGHGVRVVRTAHLHHLALANQHPGHGRRLNDALAWRG
jgi:hypothetical protein